MKEISLTLPGVTMPVEPGRCVERARRSKRAAKTAPHAGAAGATLPPAQSGTGPGSVQTRSAAPLKLKPEQLAHEAGALWYCDQCGKPIAQEIRPGYGTGYGLMRDGGRVCYACCADIDKAAMRDAGIATLYLTLRILGDETLQVATARYRAAAGKRYGFVPCTGAYVSNWPGSLKIPVITCKIGRHNIAGTRYDVWFMFEGALWHGVQYGDWTQVCHCKRLKGKKRG